MDGVTIMVGGGGWGVAVILYISVSSFHFSILLSFFLRFTICVPSCWAPEHYHLSPYLSLSISPWGRSHYISCHEHDNIIRPVLGDWRLGWRRRVEKEDFGYMLGGLLLLNYAFYLFCHVIFGESWIYYLTKKIFGIILLKMQSHFGTLLVWRNWFCLSNIGLMQYSLRWWKIDLVGVIERIWSWRQWQKTIKRALVFSFSFCLFF